MKLKYILEGYEEIWYHADPNKRSSFERQRMDLERGGQGNPNANGPGIYWAKTEDDVAGYGKYIHKAIIKTSSSRIITDKTKATVSNITKLINACSKEKRDYALTNWAENPREALSLAIKSYVNLEFFIDAAISIYHDIFNYDANEWAKAMVKIGYDAYSPSKVPHLVVYNPNIIKIIEVTE